jgi:hypothetical protein
MKIFVGIIFSVSLLLNGCGGGGGVDPNNSAVSTDSSTMSLENVSQLMVAPVGLTASTVALNKPSLMKAWYALLGIQNAEAQSTVSNQVNTIGSTGTISPSRVADIVAGKPTSASSNWVTRTPKFVIISYSGLYKSSGTGVSPQQCNLVAVRVSDGLLSCISIFPRCDFVNACDVTNFLSQIKVDTSGNIFFVVGSEASLYKVDLTKPLTPVVSTIFTHSAIGDAQNPVVNSNGAVFVSINILSSDYIQSRIYPANGTFTVISDPKSTNTQINDNKVGCAFPGVGSHSTSFYYLSMAQKTQTATLSEIVSNGNGTFTKVEISSSPAGGDKPLAFGDCAAVASQADRTFAIGYKIYGNAANRLYEILNPTNTPKIHMLNNEFDAAISMKSCSNGLVILGINAGETSHGIDRFESSASVVSHVLPVGKYLVKSMTFAGDCAIDFVGVRLLDKANVIGSIDPLNTLKITVLSASATSIATSK